MNKLPFEKELGVLIKKESEIEPEFGKNPEERTVDELLDFGIINSILRSNYFPPTDIWFSGHTINYYYFGHLVTALLIKITNIKASIGYNLMLTTIFAISMTSVFTICINLINIFSLRNLNVSRYINYVSLNQQPVSYQQLQQN